MARARGGGRSDPRGRSRGGKVRVRTARGRKTSSTRWLQRQLNDPYVAEARRQGYRSRAAFKLLDLDDRYHLLDGARRVVDLGAAPGGWSQVAAQRLKAGADILAIDLTAIEPIAGVRFLQMDFMDPAAPERLKAALGGPVDVVLSDMANAATGHRQTDHFKTMALAEAALDFAVQVLAPGGRFVAKVLRGGSDGQLLDTLKRHFGEVRHAKPPSSRKESTEWYVVAKGFRVPPA